MRSGLITPEELFGLLLQEKERLVEELCSTTINTQVGSAPSHAMLTQSTPFIQPILSINTNQSSILGQPPLSIYLAHNSPNHAQSMVPQQYPIPLGLIIVRPSIVCKVKYVLKLIMMIIIVTITPI